MKLKNKILALVVFLLLCIFVSECPAQPSVDDILNIKSFDFGKEVITTPVGYYDLHEGSSVVEHNDQLIWMGTLRSFGTREYSIHYWTCNYKTDLEEWNYRGVVRLYGAGMVLRQGEDPSFYFDPIEKRWHLYCEDKSTEAEFKMFWINHYKSYTENINDGFMFLGGSSGLGPSGDGFMRDAVYSPDAWKTNHRILFFDGRIGKYEENIGYAEWNGQRWVPNPTPIFVTSQIPGALTTGLANSVYELTDKYIMEIVAYIGFPPDGYWCQGLAVSNSLFNGWEVLNADIKNENGKHVISQLFYTDLYGWKALATTHGEENMYLADIVTGSAPPPPPPNNDAIVEDIRERLYQIDNLLDEIE